ncbi:hypothetical protein H5410_004259, partial [Solanum commersonii]
YCNASWTLSWDDKQLLGRKSCGGGVELFYPFLIKRRPKTLSSFSFYLLSNHRRPPIFALFSFPARWNSEHRREQPAVGDASSPFLFSSSEQQRTTAPVGSNSNQQQQQATGEELQQLASPAKSSLSPITPVNSSTNRAPTILNKGSDQAADFGETLKNVSLLETNLNRSIQ